MRAKVMGGLQTAGLSALLLGSGAHAQDGAPDVAALQVRIDSMQRQLEEQRIVIDALALQLSQAHVAHHPGHQAAPGYGALTGLISRDATAAVSAASGYSPTHTQPFSAIRAGAPGAATDSESISRLGPGTAEAAFATAAGSPLRRDAGAAEAGVASEATLASRRGTGAAAAAATIGAALDMQRDADSADSPDRSGQQEPRTREDRAAQNSAVGRPPAQNGRPPEVAPLFEEPGVLTPKGKFVFEPALQFSYSSSNRVALVGYTVIPALLIGLVDVREVKRNTTTAVFGGRMGISRRFEIDAKIPYVYRSDATVSREIFTGTAVEKVFSTSGKDIGDAELGLRYQINNGGIDKPFYVGSLRIKSRTGRDPFSVVTDCTRRCTGPNATGTGLPLDLPTGSGFYSVQPGLTWLFPSDPAVFFGSVSYLHNFKRSNVSRTVLGGEKEWLGDIEPGDIVGFNFGMGLGLNEKASLSLGYDHNSIGRTRQAGKPVAGSVRTQLGTLLLGYSYRISERRSLNVSVGAGLTRDTPDVSLTVRVPTTF